jgi:hypothetical protein
MSPQQPADVNIAAAADSGPVSPFSTDPTNAILLGQARHALTILATLGAARGFYDASMVQAVVSILLMAAVMFWSAWQKTAAARKYSAEFSQAVAVALSILPSSLDTPPAPGLPEGSAVVDSDSIPLRHGLCQGQSAPQSAPSYPEPAPPAANGAAGGFVGLRVLACLAVASLVGCAGGQQLAKQLDSAALQLTPSVPDAVPSAMTKDERRTLARDQKIIEENLRLRRGLSSNSGGPPLGIYLYLDWSPVLRGNGIDGAMPSIGPAFRLELPELRGAPGIDEAMPSIDSYRPVIILAAALRHA